MKVLMVLDRDYENFKKDTRVIKEANTLQKNGFEVTIAINDYISNKDIVKDFNFDIAFCGEKRTTNKINKNSLEKIIWFIKFLNKSRKFKKNIYKKMNIEQFNVFHLHDLETLSLAKRLSKKGKVIYDSHEYWVGHKSLTVRPGKYLKRFVKWYEKKYVNKYVDKVITVSESISQKMSECFSKEIVVIKNIAIKTIEENNKIEDFLKNLGRKYFLLVYEGNIDTNRGVDNIVKKMIHLPSDVALIILGDGPGRSTIEKMMEIYNLKNRIYILGFQPYTQVLSILRKTHLAILPIQINSESYRMALPNKFFDAILAGVPILSTNMIEVEKIIKEYQNGEIYNNEQNFYTSFYKIYKNYNLYKRNAVRASKDFSWENEASKLIEMYKELV